MHGIRKFAWRACLDGACARILPFARFAANCFVCFCVRKFGERLAACGEGERLAACGEGERPEEGSPIVRRTRSAKNSSRPSWNLCGRMRNANNSRPSQRRAARVAAKGTCVQTISVCSRTSSIQDTSVCSRTSSIQDTTALALRMLPGTVVDFYLFNRC